MCRICQVRHWPRIKQLFTPLVACLFLYSNLCWRFLWRCSMSRPPGHPRTSAIASSNWGSFASRRGQIVSEYQQLIDPGRRISPGITALTGITTEMVLGQPGFTDQLPGALQLLRGAIVIGHNIRFDLSFLCREFRRSGLEMQESLGNVPVLDTVRIARRRFGRGGNGLQQLAPGSASTRPSPTAPWATHKPRPRFSIVCWNRSADGTPCSAMRSNRKVARWGSCRSTHGSVCCRWNLRKHRPEMYRDDGLP